MSLDSTGAAGMPRPAGCASALASCEPYPVSGTEQHPDHELVARVSAAMSHWSTCTDVPAVTSQVTGGGAIAAVEAWMTRAHGDRPAVLLPSATYGLRVALQVLGVQPGDRVMVPAVDWPASTAAVRSLNAQPIFING